MEKQNWQHITLGDIYRNGIAKLRQARRKYQAYSPLKVDPAALRNLWEAIGAKIGGPLLYLLQGMQPQRMLPTADELETPAEKVRRKPWQNRTEELHRVMTIAWEQGLRTYRELSAWVKEQTGKGCSMRAIARFKKQQANLDVMD